MEKLNRKELLSVVEKQNNDLQKYRTKFRDVVQAYKELQKEKDALEASWKALAETNSPSSEDVPEAEESTGRDEDESSTVGSEATDGEMPSGVDVESMSRLRVQLATLQKTLATISEQKSKMEASFLVDKKKLVQEKQDIEKELDDINLKLSETISTHKTQLEEANLKVMSERRSREEEQKDQAAMLKELQQLISDERKQNTELHSENASLRTSLEKNEVRRSRIQDLQNQLEVTRRKLEQAEQQAQEPPLLLHLQKEMAEMKAQHRMVIFQEQQRAKDAEDKASRLRRLHEERVANLESRLTDLSETVGQYDRLRQQDQIAIQKLKERITQLDLENTALARVATTAPDISTFTGKKSQNLKDS